MWKRAIWDNFSIFTCAGEPIFNKTAKTNILNQSA